MAIHVVDVDCPHCKKPIISEVHGPNKMVECRHCRSTCSILASNSAVVRELTAHGKCACDRYLEIVGDEIKHLEPAKVRKPAAELVGAA